MTTTSTRPEDSISRAECHAWRTLYDGEEYTHSMLAFMFETRDETIARHLNGECDCWELKDDSAVSSRQRFSDEDLEQAWRIVREMQPYQRMSQDVYDKHRPPKFPAAATLIDRLGPWTQIRDELRA